MGTPTTGPKLPQPFTFGATGGTPLSLGAASGTPQGATGGTGISGVSGRSQVARWKELKISGQIGSPGQKDKLTYIGLSFQIASAQQRGFEGPEICAAVIRAISPGEDLRTYLEMCPSLTLESLIPILRTHFKEKDATLVFSELSNGTQGPNESENDFCLRMMSLRQKVLLMSREEGGQYTNELVQSQFQKSLATGFRREAIRQQLRTILKTTIDDLQLLREISDVVMNEGEHDTKLKTKATVSNLKVEAKDNSKLNQEKLNPTKPNNPIVAEITKLTSQVSQLSGLHSGLKGEMENLKREFQGALNGNNVGQVAYTFPQTGSLGNHDGGQANNPPPMGWAFPSTTGLLGNQDGRQVNNPPPNSNGAANNGFLGNAGRGQGNFRGRGGGPSRGRGGQKRAFGRRLGCDPCVQAGIFCKHCLQCGAEGHRFFECPKCPLCGEDGHRYDGCPHKPKNESGEQS